MVHTGGAVCQCDRMSWVMFGPILVKMTLKLPNMLAQKFSSFWPESNETAINQIVEIKQ